MGTATLAVQKGVLALLASDPFFLMFPVFEDVPEDMPFPYLAVSPLFETAVDVFDSKGRQVILVLHAFDTTAGYRPLEQCADHLMVLLHHIAPFPVQGYHCIFSEMQMLSTVREPDGITRHLLGKCRILVETLEG